MKCHLDLPRFGQWGKLVAIGPFLSQLRRSMCLQDHLLGFRMVHPTMVVVHGANCGSVGCHWVVEVAMAADEWCKYRHWNHLLDRQDCPRCRCSYDRRLAEAV